MRIEFFTSQVTSAVGRKARPQFDLRIERYFLAISLFIFFGKLVFSFSQCARGIPPPTKTTSVILLPNPEEKK